MSRLLLFAVQMQLLQSDESWLAAFCTSDRLGWAKGLHHLAGVQLRSPALAFRDVFAVDRRPACMNEVYCLVLCVAIAHARSVALFLDIISISEPPMGWNPLLEISSVIEKSPSGEKSVRPYSFN